jgi:hypothetical protein
MMTSDTPRSWSDVEAILYRAFNALRERVNSRVPSMHAGAGQSDPPSKFTPFYFHTSYTREQSQELEDVVLSMRCRRRSAAIESWGSPIPEGSREYLYFEIERGTGESLQTVGPRWLTVDSSSDEYWREVGEFTQQVVDEIERSTEMIIREVVAPS